MTGSGDKAARQFEIVERETAYRGFYQLDVLKLRHTRFAGGWSDVFTRELYRQREAVAVLPYDPVTDRVVLIEQFRTGAIDAPEGPWLIEAPAGLREPGEEPDAVARRELEEECGLVARRLQFVCRYRSSPGVTSESADVYVGEVTAPAGGGVFGMADEHEDILSHVIAADEAFAWFAAGRITAVTAVISLQYLMLHRARLRREWAGID